MSETPMDKPSQEWFERMCRIILDVKDSAKPAESGGYIILRSDLDSLVACVPPYITRGPMPAPTDPSPT